MMRRPCAPLPAGPALLRPWREEDAEALARAARDPDVQRWIAPAKRPGTPELARAFVAEGERRWGRGDLASFAVVSRETGALLGSVAVTERAPRVATVSFWLAPAARGNGIATEVLRAVARWTLETQPIDRLAARALAGHAPSQRVLEAAGFLRGPGPEILADGHRWTVYVAAGVPRAPLAVTSPASLARRCGTSSVPSSIA